MNQWLKEFTHNCIVHPLMMFVPKKLANVMHDINADWCFGKYNRYDELKLEDELNTKYGQKPSADDELLKGVKHDL